MACPAVEIAGLPVRDHDHLRYPERDDVARSYAVPEGVGADRFELPIVVVGDIEGTIRVEVVVRHPVEAIHGVDYG